RLPQHPEEGSVYRLLNQSGSNLAEILPGKGFNCFCWESQHQGKTLDLLFGDALFGPTGKATRGGMPILFPFPNRIRGGRFVWEGQTYSIPPNDPAGNAIHGFACRHPWRVVDEGATSDSAWVTGEFQGSVDAPDAAAFWPADYLIRITYRLFENS